MLYTDPMLILARFIALNITNVALLKTDTASYFHSVRNDS